MIVSFYHPLLELPCLSQPQTHQTGLLVRNDTLCLPTNTLVVKFINHSVGVSKTDRWCQIILGMIGAAPTIGINPWHRQPNISTVLEETYNYLPVNHAVYPDTITSHVTKSQHKQNHYHSSNWKVAHNFPTVETQAAYNKITAKSDSTAQTQIFVMPWLWVLFPPCAAAERILSLLFLFQP